MLVLNICLKILHCIIIFYKKFSCVFCAQKYIYNEKTKLRYIGQQYRKGPDRLEHQMLVYWLSVSPGR